MYEVFGEHRIALTPGDDGSRARDAIRSIWGDAPAGDLDAMLRVDRELELPDSHCVKVDVACMAHGVEARSPWLDREVVAACDALPPEQRIHRGRTKVALRAMLRRRLPNDVVEHVLSRPKRGFTAGLDDALATTEAGDLLLGGALHRVPGLVPEAARPWLVEHRAGRGNHRFRLSVLLALALFAERHLG
jgi:asparagine synthase (glutamine-hydrolysing)